jgi:hypothetical protein
MMRWTSLIVCLLCVVTAGAAFAEPVDTEHMFGFSEGTDIGVPFHPEAEVETVGRAGKSAGNFLALTTTASLKYPLSPQFRIAPGIAFASYNVSGVPDFSDTSEFVFDHAVLEFRWHPLGWETNPFGLTFVATPFYGPIDPATGAGADNYGIQFIAAVDRALIADKLFAAVNLLYEFDRTRPWNGNTTFDSSVLGLSAAASLRILPWLFVGLEVRYLQGYEGLALAGLSDQALYVGPTFYMTLGKGASLSGAFEPQAWGSLTGSPSGLDLVAFDRQQFKIRLAMDL